LGITRTAARVMILPEWMIRAALPIVFSQFNRRPDLIARGLLSVSTAFLD
jgi:hypothetical protein